jgi:glucose-1-phosphate cytidylyltransferase
MTGGRIKKAQEFIGDESFMLTYGDGVSNIDINELVKFHKSHGKAMTMTSAQPDGRFGALNIDNNNKVNEFKEKPKGDGSWINAGYFVCEPEVFDYITEGDSTVFEQEPLKSLAKEGEIFTYKHHDFWMPMDTLRDKIQLNEMWDKGTAAWKVWKK